MPRKRRGADEIIGMLRHAAARSAQGQRSDGGRDAADGFGMLSGKEMCRRTRTWAMRVDVRLGFANACIGFVILLPCLVLNGVYCVSGPLARMPAELRETPNALSRRANGALGTQSACGWRSTLANRRNATTTTSDLR